jgi:hypothetical protein
VRRNKARRGLIGSETVTLCGLERRAAPQPPAGSTRAKRVLGAGTTSYRSVSVPDDWNYWNELERLEQAFSQGVLKRWRSSIRRSNRKFFRQSETILRDLQHHSLPQRHISWVAQENEAFRPDNTILWQKFAETIET